MLQELIRTISSKGGHTLQALAQQLDVSETLLEAMLDDLVRMGYLQSIEALCSGCRTCSVASACAAGKLGRMWLVTEAGKRLAQ